MNLFKTTSVYVGTNLINALVPFILIPYLTSKLSVHSYGLLSLFTLSISFLTPLFGFSTHGAFMKRFYEQEKFKIEAYFMNCVYILVFTSVLFFILFYFFPTVFSSIFLLPSDVIIYILVICIGQFMNTITLNYFRVQKKTFHYAIYQISISILNLVLTILLISIFDLDWYGRILAWAIINSFFLIMSIFYLYLKKYILFDLNLFYMFDAFKFSIPLIPHTIGALLIGFMCRFILGTVEGKESVGIFSLALQFSLILFVVFSAINSAFTPYLFDKLKNNLLDKASMVHLSYQLMFVKLVITVIGLVFIYFSFDWFVGAQFIEAKKSLVFLFFAYFFNGVYFIVTNYVFYFNKTKYLGYSTFIISLLNIPICYFFALRYNALGAAISFSISYFLLMLLTWILSYRVFPLPWLSEFNNSFKRKNISFKFK